MKKCSLGVPGYGNAEDPYGVYNVVSPQGQIQSTQAHTPLPPGGALIVSLLILKF